MQKLISCQIYNCINSAHIADNHFIFSRITCLIQPYMLINLIENTKGKCQFGELKSCYPMTT